MDLPGPVTRELPTTSSPCITGEGGDALVNPWQIVKAPVQIQGVGDTFDSVLFAVMMVGKD